MSILFKSKKIKNLSINVKFLSSLLQILDLSYIIKLRLT